MVQEDSIGCWDESLGVTRVIRPSPGFTFRLARCFGNFILAIENSSGSSQCTLWNKSGAFVQNFTLSFKRPVTAMDICNDEEWIWVGLASSDGTATVFVLEDTVWDPITVMAVKQIHGFAITSLKITPPTHPLFPAFLITASADGSVSITRYNIHNRIRKIFDWIVWLIIQTIQITIILFIIKVLSQYYPKAGHSEDSEVRQPTETMDDRRKPMGIQTNFDLPSIISRLRIKASILGNGIKRKAVGVVELVQKWRAARTESLSQEIASVSEEGVELVELAEVPEFPEESTTLGKAVEHSTDTHSQSPTRTETVQSQTTTTATEPHYKQTHHGMKPMSSFRESSATKTTTTPTKTVTETPVPTSTTQVATSDIGASISSTEQIQSITTDVHDKENVVSKEHAPIVEHETLAASQAQKEPDAKAEHTLHGRKFSKTTTEHQPTSTIASQETLIVNGKGESMDNLDVPSNNTNQSQTNDQPISIEKSSENLTFDHTSRIQSKIENEKTTTTTLSEPKPTSVHSKGEVSDLAGMDDSVGSLSNAPSFGTDSGSDKTLRKDNPVIEAVGLTNTVPERNATDTTVTVIDEHESVETSSPDGGSTHLDHIPHPQGSKDTRSNSDATLDEPKPDQVEDVLTSQPSHVAPIQNSTKEYSEPQEVEHHPPQPDTDTPLHSIQNKESDKDEDAAANDELSDYKSSESDEQDDSWPDFPHFDL